MVTAGIIERLKNVRSVLGLTQQELGKMLGKSRSQIFKYETGKTPVSQRVALKMQQELRVNKEWLMTGKGEMFLGEELQGDAILSREAPPGEGSNDGVKIHQMLQKTAEILETRSIYRTALTSNINAFHQAIQSEEAIGEVRRENAEIKAVMQGLKSQFTEIIEDMKILKQENIALKKEFASGIGGTDQDYSATVEPSPSGSSSRKRSGH